MLNVLNIHPSSPFPMWLFNKTSNKNYLTSKNLKSHKNFHQSPPKHSNLTLKHTNCPKIAIKIPPNELNIQNFFINKSSKERNKFYSLKHIFRKLREKIQHIFLITRDISRQAAQNKWKSLKRKQLLFKVRKLIFKLIAISQKIEKVFVIVRKSFCVNKLSIFGWGKEIQISAYSSFSTKLVIAREAGYVESVGGCGWTY